MLPCNDTDDEAGSREDNARPKFWFEDSLSNSVPD